MGLLAENGPEKREDLAMNLTEETNKTGGDVKLDLDSQVRY